MKINKGREAKSNLLPLYIKNHSVGKVHSKFNNGFNVQFGEHLIYISSIKASLSAFGLNIKEEVLRQLLYSVNIQDIVISKGDKLLFYSNFEIITVDYTNIEVINLTLPKINCCIDNIANTKLYRYLKRINFQEIIGIDIDDVTCKYLDLLLSSDKDNFMINSKIIRYFTGRGKGLTPSGDDILTGFTLALMMFGKFNNWTRAIQSEVTTKTTTIISTAYLNALLEGYASEQFIQLIMLIDEDTIDTIYKVVNKVQSYGHTSGNDTLFGFFLGLKFLINKEE